MESLEHDMIGPAYYGGQAMAQPTLQEGGSISYFDEAIERLAHQIEVLERTVMPVLRVSPDSVDPSSANQKQPPSSALRVRIEQINSLTARLFEITSLIDL